MLKITDFFQPLNFINLAYFAGFVIFFDIAGTFIKTLFIRDEEIEAETRLLNWLIGIGFFIFVWFFLGFFIEPNRINLLISIAILTLISLPFYLKYKNYLSWVKFVKPLLLPLVLIIPFLPSTFVKASLPPYVWDEMAYHFISPYTMLHELKDAWVFTGGLYQNLPRLMDTLYILTFSITHTYSVVRLLQFFILVTSLLVSFLFIKKFFNWISALLFVLIFLSLPIQIPFNATIGYVDFPAISFLLIGLILGITFLVSNKKPYLVLSFIFWAMAIGTKNTTLIPFVGFIISFLTVYRIKNISFKKLLDKRLIIGSAVAVAIFGAYWYIKNFVIYGNPVYPLIFPCWGKYAGDCAKGSSFFGTWTTTVNFQSLYPIIKELIPQNTVLHLALGLSIFIIGIYGDKKNRLLLLMFAILWVIEFLVMKYFSGFVLRYQQYLEFDLILILVLLAATKFKQHPLKSLQFFMIVTILLSCLFFYFKNTKDLNSLKFVEWNEINYSLGRETLFEWLKYKLPDVSDATIYCDTHAGEPLGLVILDPDMIWFTRNGLNRVFMLGCYYYYPPNLSVDGWKDVVTVAKERRLQFWTISANPCVSPDKLEPGLEKNKADQKFKMRQINNLIVCNSTEVAKNLYYFDYEKLK